ncbi:hypothetical protein NQ315_005770 [Exocentrus adspersus]|uniref:Uncharacterized protein n=1 Tax=Exocentrus adspersus TaxID=1586481 RepID=A0AAV8V7U5_9CUCU|nr:hypothetical protein NQ315_005770 [Exocentrus adspersus]
MSLLPGEEMGSLPWTKILTFIKVSGRLEEGNRRNQIWSSELWGKNCGDLGGSGEVESGRAATNRHKNPKNDPYHASKVVRSPHINCCTKLPQEMKIHFFFVRGEVAHEQSEWGNLIERKKLYFISSLKFGAMVQAT